MSVNPKVMILTGAPSARSLKWTEAHLNAPLQPAFGNHFITPSSDENTVDRTERPAWRVLPLKAKHVPTGLTQDTPPSIVGAEGPKHAKVNYGLTEFLDIQSLLSQSESGEQLTQFLEHSFAVHKENSSSQPQCLSDRGSQPTSVATDETFTTWTGPASQPALKVAPGDALRDQLIALRNVPSASTIVSLRPQKIMRSLIVTVLSVPPARPCKNCWGGNSRPSDRLELTVADETRSGFGVTLWLPPAIEPTRPRDGERQDPDITTSVWSRTFCKAARGLRLRDIILLQDITLTEYRGKVYANSREGFTRIELLFRQVEDGSVQTGLASSNGKYRLRDLERAKDRGQSDYVMQKSLRVWNWLVSFVGLSMDTKISSAAKKRRIGDDRTNDQGAGQKKRRAELPPDTQ
ncbi:hypothetical protein MMC10_005452 [Thelotrema lepadinum]|nr:hypothetical protein [Thelotrema lepadinum]